MNRLQLPVTVSWMKSEGLIFMQKFMYLLGSRIEGIHLHWIRY